VDASLPDVQAVELSPFVAISPTRDDNTNWEPYRYEALIFAVSARWGLSAKFPRWQLQRMVSCRSRLNEVQLKAANETSRNQLMRRSILMIAGVVLVFGVVSMRER
jgi:hypothetical protein